MGWGLLGVLVGGQGWVTDHFGVSDIEPAQDTGQRVSRLQVRSLQPQRLHTAATTDDGRTDEERTGGRTDGQAGGRMDEGWTNEGRTDRRVDGRTDGRMDG